MASEAPERINVQVSPLTGDLHLPTFLHLGGWDTVAYIRADLAASTPAPGGQQPDLVTVERMEIHIEPTAEGLWRATCPQARGLHVVGKTPAGALHAASDALAEVPPGSVWAETEMQREDARPKGETAFERMSGVIVGDTYPPRASSEGRCVPASHRFRKKVVIEAVQLGAVGETEPSWWTKAYTGGAARLFSDGHAEIDTLEGTIHAEVGDWIIRGVKGELYPCRDDIFRMTYEEAP